jgi:anti-repressor protein
MEELIKISKSEGGKDIVSARELYEYLGASERFSAWFDRQITYGFVEKLDYVGCKVFNALAKQDLDDFAITTDMAKEVCMIQRSDKGKQARLYFIEREKQSRSIIMPELTRKDLALMVVKAEEEKELLQAKIDQDAPKVKAAEIMLMSDDTITVAEFAKSIKRGPNKFHRTLRDDKILIDSGNRHNLPFQRYLDAGYFEVKEKSEVINNKVKLFHQTRITTKGQIYLTNKYA